ncbi:hypothetical protein O6P43_013700 [Quillaja saponaria]|uniref:Uncharacterized protein n=1 Tax=Quillaja saponaria TaxID=32244 RepID=A0AAD7PQW0_QUISA|nr:hypothetical protein O6P43_013700 [Quillaja saponaria]
MAVDFSNMFTSCFSESSSSSSSSSSDSKRYICDGDVCVLRNQKKSSNGEKIGSKNNSERKQILKISLALLSMRRSPTT